MPRRLTDKTRPIEITQRRFKGRRYPSEIFPSTPVKEGQEIHTIIDYVGSREERLKDRIVKATNLSSREIV